MDTRLAWNSFNHRRRKKGLPTLTFEKWIQMRKEGFKDKAGRFNPRMTKALEKMEKEHGKRIYTEKSKCIRCSKKKPLYQFSVRYDKKNPGIQSYCRDCEKGRLQKYVG